jgi:hypothetical protein
VPDAFPTIVREKEGEHGGSNTVGKLIVIGTQKCNKEAGRKGHENNGKGTLKRTSHKDMRNDKETKRE